MEIIKLNLIPSGVNPVCHCSQYDNGRVIRCELFNGLTPYTLANGDTVTLNARKPDNTIITASITATQGNNYVDITTTEQLCAVVGETLCKLKITNGSTEIGTLIFYMQVERDVLSDGDPSESVIKDLDSQIQEAIDEGLLNSIAIKFFPNIQYNTASDLFDADNAADNTIYALQIGSKNAIANMPDFITFNTSTRYFLLTLKYSTFKTQYIISRIGGEILARRDKSANWTTWNKLTKNGNKQILIPEKIDLSLCTANGGRDTFYVSDNIIPSGTFLEGVRFYSREAWNKGLLYLIDNATSKCIFKKVLQTKAGWNYTRLNYKVTRDCVVGINGVLTCYGHYSANKYGKDYAFSMGWISGGAGVEHYLGDDMTRTVNQWAGECFMLPVQLIYSTNDAGIYNDPVKSHDPIKFDLPIVSFIDDDCNIAFYETWSEIIAQKNIRLGLACITNRVGNSSYPNTMTLEQVKALYNAGHEVYSHSFSHPDFDGESITNDQVVEECYKSKDWLFNNGFCRGNDVFVYSGGISDFKASRIRIVNQFYKFGVNAYGNVNSTPLNYMNIYRVNADTATLEELKAYADIAIAYNTLMVCMNHSHVLIQDKDNQIAKIEAFIDYLNSKSVDILPLREALARIYGW